MPRGTGVYVDEKDGDDDARQKAERAGSADKTPDVHKPEPGSEPPD
jgi:hypothetical protein